MTFDWAGTIVDFGSCAPARAFQNLFSSRGISIESKVVRGPMGTNKRDHLIEILNDPAVDQAWLSIHGRPWKMSDVDELYDAFIKVQIQTIEETSVLVPGLLEAVAQLRQKGVKIAGTTGYFREAAQSVRSRAAESGFLTDFNVCADDVPEGRPAPWMIYRAMENLNVYPSCEVVNVGDTVADIKAGLAADCWSVAVCDSSSVMGLSPEKFNALTKQEKQSRMEAASDVFRDAGAHAVLQTIADLPGLIENIEAIGITAPKAVC